TGMKLRKCLYCTKDIAVQLEICPYCQHDANGRETVSPDAATAAADAQTLDDLARLSSDDSVVQKQVSERLVQRGVQVVPLVVRFLNEHKDKSAKGAARILGRLRDRRAVAALAQALKIGDEETRLSAVWALSQINDSQALEELLRESDRNDPTVQSY